MRLDGNAIAGTMLEAFGQEMTSMSGTCASCGEVAPLAEAIVYLPAPGIVARCPSCSGVWLVIVPCRGRFCVDMSGLASLY